VKESDMRSTKLNVLSMIMGLGLAVAGANAGAAADGDSLQQVVERGKDLFMTATFKGNGRHCNTCHKGGGTAMSELPNGKKFASLSNAASIFPRYDAENHRVKTLLDQVQHCVGAALKGKPPAYDSAEMTELVSYITSLSQGKPVDMDGKPK
jgi:thiosulfate dehydrogenase